MYLEEMSKVKKIKDQDIDTDDLDWKQIWHKVGNIDDDRRCWFNCWKDNPISPEDVAKRIIEILDIKKTDKVLEIGCGNGAIASYMAKHCDYYGVDYSSSMLKKFERLKDKNLQVKLFQMEANNLNFENKIFDKAFSFSVFHYFPNYEYAKNVLNEVERVTKKSFYIGDIPHETFRESHLLYTPEFFENSELIKGLSDLPRFGVLYNLE